MAASKVTAETMWATHRAVLGGRSAVTGAPLPETLAECNPGVQAAHWGLALTAALTYGDVEPPVPLGVTAEEAARVRVALAG